MSQVKKSYDINMYTNIDREKWMHITKMTFMVFRGAHQLIHWYLEGMAAILHQGTGWFAPPPSETTCL